MRPPKPLYLVANILCASLATALIVINSNPIGVAAASLAWLGPGMLIGQHITITTYNRYNSTASKEERS